MLNGLNCRGGRGLKIGGDITTPHTLYETLDVTHTSPFSILNRTSFKIDVALTPPDKKKHTTLCHISLSPTSLPGRG